MGSDLRPDRLGGRPSRGRLSTPSWLVCTLAALNALIGAGRSTSHGQHMLHVAYTAALGAVLSIGPSTCYGQQALGMVAKFEREKAAILRQEATAAAKRLEKESGTVASGHLQGKLSQLRPRESESGPSVRPQTQLPQSSASHRVRGNGVLQTQLPQASPRGRDTGNLKLIPQRSWTTFPRIGLATFSSYRVRSNVYVLLAHVLRPFLDGPLSLKDKTVSCSLRTATASGEGEGGASPEEGAIEGVLYPDATVDHMHPGAWIFVALFCHFPDAPPSALGTRGEVLLLSFGAQTVAAAPEDARPGGGQDASTSAARTQNSLLDTSEGGHRRRLPETSQKVPEGAKGASPGGNSTIHGGGDSPQGMVGHRRRLLGLPQNGRLYDPATGAVDSTSSETWDSLPGSERPLLGVTESTQGGGDSGKKLLNFCSPPLFGTALVRTITDWVVYHQHSVGFDHFFFYLAIENKEEWVWGLKDYLRPQDFTVLDFGHAVEQRSWAHAQALAINDCLHWNRRRADWVAFADLDEYIFVRNLPPFNSLRYFLRHNASRCSEVNRGSVSFDLFCNGTLWDPGRETMAVELLEYRRLAPHCSLHFRTFFMNASHCTDWWGHRKSVVRTEEVYLAGVHTVYTPPFPAFPPVNMCNMSAFDIHNAHYSGFTRPAVACEEVPEEAPRGRMRSRAVADVAREARLCRGAQRGSRNCFRGRQH